MLELRTFTGHVVAAEQARRVVAPPYDALAPAARAALAATDPDSYLGALPPGTAADTAQLETALRRCRDHLDRLFAAGRYRSLPGPALGVLAIGRGTGRAVAVVGDVPVTAFAALDEPRPFAPDDGLVRPHELVQPPRVDQLTRYLEVVGVASSPVALTHRPDPEVTAAVAAVLEGPPDLAYRAGDGVDVALWCVLDPASQERITGAVAAAGPVHLADGHHRGAAAVRYAAATGAGVEDPAGRVLCAVLPSDHLAVQAFHRRVDGVLDDPPVGAGDGRVDPAVTTVLDHLTGAGVGVTPLDGPAAPSEAHRVTVTAGERWWELDVRSLVRGEDPVAALDVALVDRELLPRLAVAARRSDLEATPVAAPLGLGALSAPGAVGFALHPPSIEVVLALADAGRTLPPKTTYVTPKLRSGLLVTPRPSPSHAAGADRRLAR